GDVNRSRHHARCAFREVVDDLRNDPEQDDERGRQPVQHDADIIVAGRGFRQDRGCSREPRVDEIHLTTLSVCSSLRPPAAQLPRRGSADALGSASGSAGTRSIRGFRTLYLCAMAIALVRTNPYSAASAPRVAWRSRTCRTFVAETELLDLVTGERAVSNDQRGVS